MELRIGRYVVFEPIAAGGMASVHFGRMRGPLGFARTVAVKRIHPHLLEDGELIAMLIEEARLAARIQHPAVVQTLDVVSDQGEVLLVMEYVDGESLAKLLRGAVARGAAVPVDLATSIAVQMLRGLHAAHEVADESGRKLDLVHRDVSPQNLLVGAEGEVKVIDFGIAKALGRAANTRAGELKGKLAYMSPEQLRSGAIDRRTDVFAAGIVLWEMLVGARLFEGTNETMLLTRRAGDSVPPPSQRARQAGVDAALDAIVTRALAARPEDRYPTAAAMAAALESRGRLAAPSQVGAWVTDVCRDSLEGRRARLAEIERSELFAGEPSSASHDSGAPAEAPAVGALGAADPDGTEGSDGAEAAPFAPTPTPRRRRGWLPLAALAAVGLVLCAAALERRPRATDPARATAALVTSATAAVAVASSSATAAVAVASSSATAAVAVASSSATAAEPPSAAAASGSPAVALGLPSPHGGPRPARATRPRDAAQPPPSVDCASNPYTLDEQGHRRYRRECLRP